MLAACGSDDDGEPVPDPECALESVDFQPTVTEAKSRLQDGRWKLCSGAKMVSEGAGIQFTEGFMWAFLKEQSAGGALTWHPDGIGTSFDVTKEEGKTVINLVWGENRNRMTSKAFPTFDADPNRLRIDFGKPGKKTTAWYLKVR
ncbi:hypothetical protein [Vulgatibacter incomptus]|uniref:Uncharacterized protein n=1 Tax=Vulgatibacter incomptus TaxID=1391653 RepID=A0A0K1P986_9BACT|nr:hypothetical protein [Vulgatibacter incomptus]AKU89981.1 hypothetical protein AKJ08_0368 [Vulgatibacter incomptus]